MVIQNKTRTQSFKRSKSGNQACRQTSLRRRSLRIELLDERCVMAAGLLDTTFGSGGQVLTDFRDFDGATAMVVQSDGKTIAVGTASDGVNRDFAIARYNVDGSLDVSFGTGGKVTTNISGDDNASDVALTPEGKIVVVGSSATGLSNVFSVARYNIDGTLDSTFSGDGKAITAFGTNNNAQATAVAVQADGKIVASGTNTDTLGESHFGLVRYRSNGTLDITFNGTGKLLTNFGTAANAIAIQNDGKILAAGYGNNNFALARFNSNGSYDNTFDSDGRVETDLIGGSDFANALAIQADGKVVVAGVANEAAGAQGYFAVARYNADGTLDSTFDGDGKAFTNLGTSNNTATSVAIHSNGRIVVGGTYFNSSLVRFESALIRYNSNGALDSSFGSAGIAIPAITSPVSDSQIAGIALDPDGRIVVAGTAEFDSGGLDFLVARFIGDPLIQSVDDLDTTFGKGGKTSTEFFAEPNSRDEFGTASVLQPDGKTVVVGGGQVARFNSDGTPDLSFGDSAVAKFSGTATDVQLRSDGSIFVAGYRYVTNVDGSRTGYFALSAYNSDGTYKISFSSDLLYSRAMGAGETISNVFAVRQANDNFILAGTVSGGGGEFRYSTVVILRLLNIGIGLTPDNNFGTQGVVRSSFGGQFGVARSLAVQPDGKVVVGGDVSTTVFGTGSSNFAVLRLNSNGSVDTTFDGDGVSVANLGFQYSDFASSMVLQSDGKIVLAGYTDHGSGTSVSDLALIRLNANGSTDTSFNSSGLVTGNFSGANSINSANSVTLQADGKIVIAGVSNNNLLVARYLSNGILDTSFDSDGFIVLNASYPQANLSGRLNATAVEIQSEGKIIVSGSYFNGQNSDMMLARINPGGSTDISYRYMAFPGFSIADLRFSQDIADAMAIQPDGKTVVAGYISDGAQRDFGVARYNVDGTPDLSFGNQGKVITANGPGDDIATSMAIAPDGKIVVAGYSIIAPGVVTFSSVIRYNTNGTLDTTFNNSGKLFAGFGGVDEQVYSVAVQSNGKIVIAGTSNSSGTRHFALARLNVDGSLDTTFNGTGIQATSFGNIAYSVKVMPNNKIVVAGSTFTGGQSDFAVARFNSNGTFDTTFNGNGTAVIDGFGENDEAFASALQPDGKIVLTGYSFQGGVRGFSTARINVNGTLDNSFNGNGKRLTKLGNDGSYATSVAIHADGRINVVGFSRDGFQPSKGALIQYNANGSLNANFDDDGIYFGEVPGTDNTFSAIAIGSDEKITIAGYQLYSHYNTFTGQITGTNYDFTLQRLVGNSANIQAVSATTSGSNKITVTYNITGGPVSPFSIGTYLSSDKIAGGFQNAGDTFVGDILISNPADLSTGSHTLTFDIDTTGLELPGAGTVPDALLDQYLLVVFDHDDQIGEINASPYNDDSTIVFKDVYHTANRAVVAFGSDADDSIVVSNAGANLRINMNGSIYTYAAIDVPYFIIHGAGGNDTLTAANVARPMVLIGGAGNDTLVGGSEIDRLIGNQGNDTMRGGLGDDRYVFEKVVGLAELDTVIEFLNQGKDSLDFSVLSSNDAVNADLQIDPSLASHTGRVVRTNGTGQALNFESVTGGAGSDTLRGNLRDNVLLGGAGNDTLDGRAGNDVLHGGSGNDSLTGGAGDDSYLFDTATTAEIDTIFEALGGGVDTLDFGNLLTAVNVNLSSATTTIASHTKRKVLVGAAGDSAFLENVLGGSGNDSLTGNAANNYLFGNNGDDNLNGRAGVDTLDGGDGIDTAVQGEVLLNIP